MECAATCCLHSHRHPRPRQPKQTNHPAPPPQALEDDSSDDDAAPPPSGFLSSLASRLSTQLMGKAALTRADLAPSLDAIRQRLTERNVAQDVAGRVVEGVEKALLGTRLGAVTTIASVVRAAAKDALQARAGGEDCWLMLK